jgi:hypothetical protein
MKRLTLILIFGFLLALPGMMCAQQDNSDVYIQQAKNSNTTSKFSSDKNPSYGIFSKIPVSEWSYWQQTGADASMIAKVHVDGKNNITNLTQKGSQNVGILHIDGNNNDTQLTQNGADLLSFINIIGNSNMMHLDQQGKALQNYIKVSGNGIRYKVAQSEHQVELQQMGGNSIPLQVTTTGSFTPIIIQNH